MSAVIIVLMAFAVGFLVIRYINHQTRWREPWEWDDDDF